MLQHACSGEAWAENTGSGWVGSKYRSLLQPLPSGLFLTIHGDLIRLQLQDLLFEELLLYVTLQVVLALGEPLKAHL